MVPYEWPIADETADPLVDFALARSQSRLATVRRDFSLRSDERLNEQERALLTAMMHDLIGTLAVAVRAATNVVVDLPRPDRIAATLGRAGLLGVEHRPRHSGHLRDCPLKRDWFDQLRL